MSNNLPEKRPEKKRASRGAVAALKSFILNQVQRSPIMAAFQFGKTQEVVNPYNDYSWVYSAVKAIASSAAGIPVVLKDSRTGEIVENESDEWVQLFAKLSPLMIGTQFWRSLAIYQQTFGSVFIIPREKTDLSGKVPFGQIPAALEVADPRRITKRIVDNRFVGWTYKRGSTEEKFETNEIIRIYELNPDDIFDGLAPWEPANTTLQGDVKANKYNENFFDNGGQIQGVLELEGEEYAGLSEEEIEKVRADWDSKFGGVEGQHKTPVLHGGLKFKPTGLNQKDMDFSAYRVSNREEILANYRVYKTILGLTDSVDRATARVFKQMFYENTVIPLVNDWATVLNETLLMSSGYFIEFDVSGIDALGEETGTKIENGKKLQEMGYSLNEINSTLNLGMKEIEEAWANESIDARVQLGTSGPGTQENGSAGTSTDDGSKGNPGSQEKARFKVRAKNYDDLSDNELNELYIEDVLEGRNMNRFEKKMNSYFNKMQREVLKQIENLKDTQGVTKEEVSDFLFDLAVWNEILINDIGPNIETAFEESADFLEKEIGGFSGFVFDEDEAIISAMKRKKIRVTKVNDTVLEDLRSSILAGMGESENIQQLTERVRGVFDNSRSRSLTIARTEVSQSAGSARHIAMSREGLKKKWIDAGDKHVRESHAQYALAGTQPMGYDFSMGKNLKFPGDMDCTDAGEVINCRCITRAVK